MNLLQNSNQPPGISPRFVRKPAANAVRLTNVQRFSSLARVNSQPRSDDGTLEQLHLHVILRIAMCCSVVLLVGCQDRSATSIDFKGVRHWSMPAHEAKIPAPRSIHISSDREAYVLDNAGRVLVFSLDGKLLRQWMMPEYDVGKPEGLFVLTDGRVAVADTHYSRIVFFDQRGKLLGTQGEFGKKPGQFIYPVSLTEDGSGFFYVCEYGDNDRVQKFNAQGEFVAQFGSFGTAPGQFQRPSGIVWNKGKLYVADAINNRIQVFTDDGQYEGVVGGETAAELRYPYDLAQSAGNSLFVVEYGAGRLTELGVDGKLLGRWGSTGSAKGRLATPWGLAVGHDIVLIADTGNRRIVELRP